MKDHPTPIMERVERAYSTPDRLLNNISWCSCSYQNEWQIAWTHSLCSQNSYTIYWKKKPLYRECKRMGTTHPEKRYNAYRHVVQKILQKQHAEYVSIIFTDQDKSLRKNSTSASGPTSNTHVLAKWRRPLIGKTNNWWHTLKKGLKFWKVVLSSLNPQKEKTILYYHSITPWETLSYLGMKLITTANSKPIQCLRSKQYQP